MDVAALFREYVRLDRLRSEGLTPTELHRWTLLKRKLSQHFSPGLPDDRADQRESVRIPARLSVSFTSEGALARSLMTNLSRRGVFVETRHLLPIGTILDLRVHVERPSRELVVPAQVVSHDLGPRLHMAHGMGLRFLDLEPEAEKQLDELYERLVR